MIPVWKSYYWTKPVEGFSQNRLKDFYKTG